MANINDIVKTTISLRSYEFGSANIRLFESYGEGLASVVVNPEEIQQVILILILNAEQADHMPGGSPFRRKRRGASALAV